MTTINPVCNDDWIKPKNHPCKAKFKSINNLDKDYADLVTVFKDTLAILPIAYAKKLKNCTSLRVSL